MLSFSQLLCFGRPWRASILGMARFLREPQSSSGMNRAQHHSRGEETETQSRLMGLLGAEMWRPVREAEAIVCLLVLHTGQAARGPGPWVPHRYQLSRCTPHGTMGSQAPFSLPLPMPMS